MQTNKKLFKDNGLNLPWIVPQTRRHKILESILIVQALRIIHSAGPQDDSRPIIKDLDTMKEYNQYVLGCMFVHENLDAFRPGIPYVAFMTPNESRILKLLSFAQVLVEKKDCFPILSIRLHNAPSEIRELDKVFFKAAFR